LEKGLQEIWDNQLCDNLLAINEFHISVDPQYSGNETFTDRLGIGAKVCQCDCYGSDPNGIFLVGEVKPEAKLTLMPKNGAEIATTYVTTNRPNRDKVWSRSIAQLYGYMLDQKVRYGFLTSYNE